MDAREDVGARRHIDRLDAVMLALLVLAALLPALAPPLRAIVERPLWLDELHTWLLARPDAAPRIVQHLSRGADFNPPLLFWVDSALLRVFAGCSPQVVLRMTSLASGAVAACCLFLLLRTTLGRMASVTGAASVLAHTVLTPQLFEARFYAPWVALCAIAALLLEREAAEPGRSAPRVAALALTSIAICLVHWFGVISVVALAAGGGVRVRVSRPAIRVALALLAGPVVLLAFAGMFFGQRHALSIPTWIAPASLGDAASFLGALFARGAFLVVCAAGLAFHLARREPLRVSAGMAALLGLLLLPFALVAFSFVVQSSLIPRYAAPVLLALAVMVALATSRLPTRLQWLPIVVLLFTSGRLLRSELAGANRQRGRQAANVAAVNGVASIALPIVVPSRQDLYVTALSAAAVNARLVFPVLPIDSLRAIAGSAGMRGRAGEAALIVEQDVARLHARELGFPTLIDLERARRLPSLYLLTAGDEPVPPELRWFPGAAACRVRGRLWLLTASPAGTQVVGSSSVKVLPSPRVLTTDSSPCMPRASSRQIDRPSPIP